jgi:phosphohistidine phosphatase SixA
MARQNCITIPASGTAYTPLRSVPAAPAGGVRKHSIMRTIVTITLFLVAFNVYASELLWKKLQNDPNMVVLMRNSESAGNKDGSNMLVWDATGNCKGESKLTKNGQAHAKRIGEAFLKHGIKPLVISSPMCRCSETAKIAFGEYVTDPDLRQSPSSNTKQQEIFQHKANSLLLKYRGKTPIAFVNHRPNIDSLTMELLKLNEMLVGVVSESGEVEVLGKIRVE